MDRKDDDSDAWKDQARADRDFLKILKVKPFEISELDAALACADEVRIIRARANARLKRERVLWCALCCLLGWAIVIMACTGRWK